STVQRLGSVDPVATTASARLADPKSRRVHPNIRFQISPTTLCGCRECLSGGLFAPFHLCGIRMAVFVKGFRTPASHWREDVHGGRRPKSLEGGNRGGSLRRRRCRAMGIERPRLI